MLRAFKRKRSFKRSYVRATHLSRRRVIKGAGAATALAVSPLRFARAADPGITQRLAQHMVAPIEVFHVNFALQARRLIEIFPNLSKERHQSSCSV
jgi:hypothetical protein